MGEQVINTQVSNNQAYWIVINYGEINQRNGTREWEGVTAILCRVIGEDLSEEVTGWRLEGLGTNLAAVMVWPCVHRLFGTPAIRRWSPISFP